MDTIRAMQAFVAVVDTGNFTKASERLAMPKGTFVSGLESDGAATFYCGSGTGGKVRAVRKPKR